MSLIVLFMVIVFLIVFYFYKNNSKLNKEISIINNLNTTRNTTNLNDVDNKDLKKLKTYNYNIGAWLWKSPQDLNEQDIKNIFEFCNEEGIDTIYLSLDRYLDINEIKDDNLKNLKIGEFESSLKEFLFKASQYEIKVQALGGNKEWARTENHKMPLQLLDFVINFNNKNIIKFDGIQFDIEPYGLSDYNKNKVLIWKSYLFLLEEIFQKNKIKQTQNNFMIGFAIPFWLDNENNNLTNFSWKNQSSKPIGYHIFDILNNQKNAYVVIMSYRNFADGNDGSIQHSQSEIEYAENYAKNVSIIIGQETEKNEIQKVTFHGLSKQNLENEIQKIINSYKNKNVFKGIAINNILSFMKMNSCEEIHN